MRISASPSDDPRDGMSNGGVSRMDVGAEAWQLGILHPACSPYGHYSGYQNYEKFRASW